MYTPLKWKYVLYFVLLSYVNRSQADWFGYIFVYNTYPQFSLSVKKNILLIVYP